MSFIVAYHHMTGVILTATGMTDKEAHINAGLLIYVVVQFLLRTRRASLEALVAVAACEGLNEIFDYLFFAEPRWTDTLGDIAATLTWPIVLFAVSRYRRRRWARAESKRPPQRPEARRMSVARG